MAKTNYLRALTALTAIAAAALVAVAFVAYSGAASAQGGNVNPPGDNNPTPPGGDPGNNPPPGGNPNEPNPNPPGGGAPTVVSTNPPDGATNVDPDASIKAKFSEKMKKSSINASTVRVDDTSCPGSDPNQPCPNPPAPEVSYNRKKTLKLIPGFVLQPNTEYRVTIDGGADGVKDKGGTSMAQDFNFRFTTGAG